VAGRDALNSSARRAVDIGDTIKRIDGTEVPLLAPWGRQSGGEGAAVAVAPAKPKAKAAKPKAETAAPKPAARKPRKTSTE
jgi:NADH-quinone oxidoreductase subunit E